MIVMQSGSVLKTSEQVKYLCELKAAKLLKETVLSDRSRTCFLVQPSLFPHVVHCPGNVNGMPWGQVKIHYVVLG